VRHGVCGTVHAAGVCLWNVEGRPPLGGPWERRWEEGWEAEVGGDLVVECELQRIQRKL
jgi:hypothetical protein